MVDVSDRFAMVCEMEYGTSFQRYYIPCCTLQHDMVNKCRGCGKPFPENLILKRNFLNNILDKDYLEEVIWFKRAYPEYYV